MSHHMFQCPLKAAHRTLQIEQIWLMDNLILIGVVISTMLEEYDKSTNISNEEKLPVV